jgi:hypothetical protein
MINDQEEFYIRRIRDYHQDRFLSQMYDLLWKIEMRRSKSILFNKKTSEIKWIYDDNDGSQDLINKINEYIKMHKECHYSDLFKEFDN